MQRSIFLLKFIKAEFLVLFINQILHILSETADDEKMLIAKLTSDDIRYHLRTNRSLRWLTKRSVPVENSNEIDEWKEIGNFLNHKNYICLCHCSFSGCNGPMQKCQLLWIYLIAVIKWPNNLRNTFGGLFLKQFSPFMKVLVFAFDQNVPWTNNLFEYLLDGGLKPFYNFMCFFNE